MFAKYFTKRCCYFFVKTVFINILHKLFFFKFYVKKSCKKVEVKKSKFWDICEFMIKKKVLISKLLIFVKNFFFVKLKFDLKR